VKSELNVVAKRYGWRFFQKPVGLELYFLKPELKFTFFFIFFVAGCFLISFLRDVSVEIGNQTPPSTARNEAKCSDSGILA
jgi:hypothetical protein